MMESGRATVLSDEKKKKMEKQKKTLESTMRSGRASIHSDHFPLLYIWSSIYSRQLYVYSGQLYIYSGQLHIYSGQLHI